VIVLVGVGVGVELVPSLGEVLTETDTDTVTEPLTLGENTVPVPVPVPLDVQAETAMQANTLTRPQPMVLGLTRCAVHAMAVRALIGPPHAPVQRRPFPGRRPQKPVPERKRVAGLWFLGRPNNSGGENRRA
jgi:hypothetical protein